MAAKAPPAKEVRNESEGHPSAARAKAPGRSESGGRCRNAPGHSKERLPDQETVKVTEKESELEAEAPSSGESDIEALLARLRAL